MPDLASLEPLLAQHGPLIFLVLAVIEGPVVTVTAAALAQKGVLDIRLVLALAVLGDLIGDLVLYLAGRFGVSLLPRNLCRRLGLDRHVLDPMAQTFARSGWSLLMAAKWTHVAGLPTLAAAGMARMPVLSFLLCSVFATLPKVALLCLLGWSFGLALTEFDPPLWLVLPMGGAAIALLIFHLRRKDRSCA
jgi:membrane protein DedA with SNARE-associated domain